jgi:hypothetical protein
MWNPDHAARWSEYASSSYDERDRISHHTRTKQRAQEGMASWSLEEIEERISWTWEEVLARHERLPW